MAFLCQAARAAGHCQYHRVLINAEMTTPAKRTPLITIERQLWPQPPKDVRPYWCYINTLQFYDNGVGIKVWEQDIPEGTVDSCAAHPFSCSVYRDEKWGWMLKATATHEYARLFITDINERLAELSRPPLSI